MGRSGEVHRLALDCETRWEPGQWPSGQWWRRPTTYTDAKEARKLVDIKRESEARFPKLTE
jgi:hypothetical protein